MMIPIVVFAVFLILAELMNQGVLMRHLVTAIATLSLWLLICLLMYLPLYHVVMKYVLESPCGYWQTLWHNYPKALRHWGLLFLVFFVSLLLVFLVGLVVMLPSHILSFANQQAYQGVLIGDPLGMPSHIVLLTFVTTVLCTFIHFYLGQVILVHNYYVYGSIETREKERTENQSLNDQNTI